MTPQPEYGYVLIDTEEKRKRYAPKRVGDEIFMGFENGTPLWNAFKQVDSREFMFASIYRRRIDAGDGWEIVPADEKAKAGAQFTRDGIVWEDVELDSEFSCRSHFDNKPTYLAFRRRKSPALGWVSVEEERPPDGPINDVFLVQEQSGDVSTRFRWALREGTKSYSKGEKPIRWFNHPMPPAIPPKKSPALKAWDALGCELNSGKDYFLAGYNAAKNERRHSQRL